MNKIIFYIVFFFFSVLPVCWGDRDSYVIISFDDGWESVYNRAFLWLNDYNVQNNTNIRASVSVITMSFRDRPLDIYLSLNQIRHLQQNGWEILSHTVNHKLLPELTREQLEIELHQSLTDFEKAGITGVDGFVYPYGKGWDDPEIISLIREKYRYARALDDKKSLPLERAREKNNPYNIAISVYMTYNTNIPEVLAKLEKDKKEGITIHPILFHDITSREDHPAYNGTCKTKYSTFQALITALDNQGYSFITFGQALDMLDNTEAPGSDGCKRLFW